MARWIELDNLDANSSLWLMYEDMIKFDQRDPPWPNRFWPFGCWMATTHVGFNKEFMITLRRFCDRELKGDIVVRFATEKQYNDHVVFYFDNGEDASIFIDEYHHLIVRAEEPLGLVG
jgi:hypothetical protein